MKNYLGYKYYDRFSAPKLNADGTVAVGSDGLPIYTEALPAINADGITRNYPMTKKQCLDTARILAGPDVSLYTLDWVYDIDLSQKTGYLSQEMLFIVDDYNECAENKQLLDKIRQTAFVARIILVSRTKVNIGAVTVNIPPLSEKESKDFFYSQYKGELIDSEVFGKLLPLLG